LAAVSVFAQNAPEKVGLTVTTEVGFGDLGLGANYAFVTAKPPKDGEHVIGAATWVLPKIEYGQTFGKWTVNAGATLTLGSQKTYNAPNYTAAFEDFKVTYAANDAVKVWGKFPGTGGKFTPGLSYVTGPVTIEADIPLQNFFELPNIGFEPKVTYAAGPLSAYLKGVFKFLHMVDKGSVNSDGWKETENYEYLSIVQKIEIKGTYTVGPAKIEATVVIPLYKGWNDGNDGKIGDPAIGAEVAAQDPTAGLLFTGITITPKFTYTVNSAVDVYAEVKLSRIGLGSDITDQQLDVKGNKIGIGIAPTIGVSYAF
jgi:hypothetical protein